MKSPMVRGLISTALRDEASARFISRLIWVAEHSRILRKTDTLRDASFMLMNLPSRKAEHAGLYYLGVFNQRIGNREAARNLFEKVAGAELTTCQGRALQSLGFLHFREGNLSEANKFFLESNRASGHHDLTTRVFAHQAISMAKSASGDHNHALADLTRLSTEVVSIAKSQPVHWYIYQASLAYELTQVGRLDEAERALNIALACPVAPAFPEWLETRDEIQARREATPLLVSLESASSRLAILQASSEMEDETHAPPSQSSKPPILEIAPNIVAAEAGAISAQPSCAASGAHHFKIAFPIFILTASAHRGAAVQGVLTRSRLRSMQSRNVRTSPVPNNRRPRAPPIL